MFQRGFQAGLQPEFSFPWAGGTQPSVARLHLKQHVAERLDPGSASAHDHNVF